MKNITVLLLYTDRKHTKFDEAISDELVSLIYKILCTEYKVTVLDFRRLLICNLSKIPHVDFVFNLAYGYSDENVQLSQSQITTILESAGLNVLGSSSCVQQLAQDKLLLSRYLSEHKIQMPQLLSLKNQTDLPEYCIEKPRIGGCHRNVSILECRGEEIIPKDGFLYQEYIDGREFTVGVIQTQTDVLSFDPMEICFDQKPNALGTNTIPSEFRIGQGNDFHLKELASETFRLLNMKDYARMDFRMKNITEPILLDVNSMPNLDQENSFLPMMAISAGYSYKAFILNLTKSALFNRGCI